MKNFGAKWLALATVIGAVAGLTVNGCGGGDDGGGKGGVGGTAGRGGTTGTAGRGGTTGTAGTTGVSGTTGTAGRGGTTGTAGTTGGGGTGGGSGLTCPQGEFTTNALEGFALNTFMSTSAGAAINLAVREGGTAATLAWDGTDGDPAAGSLKVDAPYTDYNQYVDIQHNFGTSMIKNWTGLKLHVKAKVAGGNPSANNPMGVQPYVNTGMTYNGYCGKYVNLVAKDTWNDYVLDLSMCAAASSDPSMVIAFGVSFQAGSGTDGDGGVNSMKPVTATIHVDSFWLEGSSTCMGGTGGTGGGTAGTTGAGGGTAGTTGTGGGTAGTTGTGGRGGTGGGTAGTTGTGGGTAGTTGTGGGTAGTTGTGGTGGVATLIVSNFDTTVDSFGLNTYMDPAAGADVNLAVREAGGMATAAWDGTEGMGTPVGSVKVSAPFSGYKQYFDLTRNYGTTLQNWTGKTVMKVRFKVTAGGNPDPTYPAGAQAYVQTTSSYEGQFGYNNVAAGTDWQVASVALPATITGKPNWNLAMVQQVGLKITSGSGTGAADGAVPSGQPTAATIFIDSVWAE